LVTVDHKKPVMPVKIANCTTSTAYIVQGKSLGTLVPLKCTEKPLGPLSDSGDEKKLKSILKTMNNMNVGLKRRIPSKHKISFEEFSKYFDFSKSVLDRHQREKLLTLLYEFEDLFVKKDENVRCTKVVPQQKIPLFKQMRTHADYYLLVAGSLNMQKHQPLLLLAIKIIECSG
jgi:hypothetical protein